MANTETYSKNGEKNRSRRLYENVSVSLGRMLYQIKLGLVSRT
jgi:hypothetical protein